jgi:hypothetical protein
MRHASTSTGVSVNSSGNVGIGTASPSERLSVHSAIGVRGSNFASTSYFGSSVNTTGVYTGLDSAGGFTINVRDSGYITLSTNNTERARISAAGGFSVGTTSDPGAGAIYATGNITAYFSDDRLKVRKGNIQNALAKVEAISGFHYEANEVAQSLGYKAKPEVGVSAQEVQAVLPEVVVPAPVDEQYLTVHYDRLVPLLIEAVKELSARVKELEAK